MGKKYWAKIMFESEGVIFEKEYPTEEQALAFVDGFNACVEHLDIEDDCHHAGVADYPAKDEA